MNYPSLRMIFLLAAHLKEVVAGPSFLQRHHEKWRKTHLTEAPAPVAFHILVVVARRNHISFAIVDRLGLQVGIAIGAIAVHMQHMVMDELLHSIETASWRAVGGALSGQAAEKLLDLLTALSAPEMAELE